MKVQKYKRGQIWWYRTGIKFDGNTYNEGKPRPVILMSNDIANEKSNCLIAIPCTTQEKKDMPTHIKFYIENTQNIALAENLMSVSTEKLTDYVGEVDDELLKELERIVIVALGLEHYTNIPSPTNPVLIKKQDGFIRVDDKLVQHIYSIPNPYETYTPKPEKPKFSAILPKDIQDTNKESKSKKAPTRMTKAEKQRFLNDYENHDKDYMLKKYGIKDYKCLHQKVYMIRKEFGLGVRSK